MTVLDTHVWLWVAAEPARLSAPARRAIERALSGRGITIASISLWEAAMLAEKGRVAIQGTIDRWLAELCERTGVAIRELTPTVAAIATTLPHSFPRDPADRLIAATARAEAAVLVTADRAIRKSGAVETIW